MSQYTVVESEPNPDDATVIHAGLFAHDPADVPRRNHASLSIVLRSRSGAIAGGLLGSTMWGWLTVDALWVEPAVRGTGHGRQLLAAAEAIARRRRCTDARLDTFDFQARGFYERCGYVVYGQLEGFPTGHVHYHMRKAIPENVAAAA